MVVWIHHHTGHKGCANRALGGDVHRQLLPAQSAVARAIDPGRSGAGKEDLRINRIDRQRPDRRHIALRADTLPVGSAMVARKQAGITDRKIVCGSVGCTTNAWIRLLSGKG